VAQSANNMLSRILRGDEVLVAQAVPWRHAIGTGGPKIPTAPAQAVALATVAGKPAGVRQMITTDDQVAALQARVADLEATLERRVAEFRDAAFREGEATARAQVTAQVQPVLEKMAHSIHELSDLRSKLRHQAEGDLLKLALAIAKKILHRELSADPESLAGLIRVAMEKIRIQEVLRVRVHPQHQATVQQIVTRLSGGVGVEILADHRLPVGGVVIETTRGEFDASVDVQLREIERGLTDRLAARA
jgi:flagellar assembly protein FliH